MVRAGQHRHRPFNGEGISYAMEAGQLAAEVVDRALTTRRTADLDAFDAELRQRWGGYYQLGKVFAKLVGNPTVMHVCTEFGIPYRQLWNSCSSSWRT